MPGRLAAIEFGHHSKSVRPVKVSPSFHCSPDNVLIRVAFNEVNPAADLKKLKEISTKIFLQSVPNLEFVPSCGGSGVVSEVGENAPRHLIGKRVAFLGDISRSGSYATHVTINYRLVVEIPNNVCLREGAAVALAGCIAFQSLQKLQLGSDVNIRQDAKLLVIGGGGGVGSWAISLARALHPKLEIIATTGYSNDSSEWSLQMGANRVILHNEIETLEDSVGYVLCLNQPTNDLFLSISEAIQPTGNLCLVFAGELNQLENFSLGTFKTVNVSMETVSRLIRTKFKRIQPSNEIATMLHKLSSQIVKKANSTRLQSVQRKWIKTFRDSNGQIEVYPANLADATAADLRRKLVLKIGTDMI